MVEPNEYVAALYAATKSAVQGRDAMKEAVRQNLPQQYHRALRTKPEARAATALLAVRRQLGDLAGERRRIDEKQRLSPEMRSVQMEQVDEAMAQVAEGTMLWLADKLAGHG